MRDLEKAGAAERREQRALGARRVVAAGVRQPVAPLRVARREAALGELGRRRRRGSRRIARLEATLHGEKIRVKPLIMGVTIAPSPRHKEGGLGAHRSDPRVQIHHPLPETQEGLVVLGKPWNLALLLKNDGVPGRAHRILGIEELTQALAARRVGGVLD